MACQESNLKDWISELPDDILIHILSSLTLKEAGKTSVLSKRWRHICSHLPTLNFVDYEFLCDYNNWKTSLEEEEHKHFHWVDQVVTSHQAPTIDEFKVQFDLQECRKDSVDNWVRFAIQKRVKRFQLDLAPILSFIAPHEEPFIYTFPTLSFCNSLTSLQLGYIHVTSEAVEKLLCDCPLEYLSIVGILSIVNLKVAGPSLRLKSLRICKCWEMKHLEISAPNLTSLEYFARETCLTLGSNPKLAEVSIRGQYANHLICDFSRHLNCISQLEVLSIHPTWIVDRIAKVFPTCKRLQTLDIKIMTQTDEELFGLVSLLENCPVLQKFVLQFFHLCDDDVKRTERTRNFRACPHHSLKTLELVGYTGRELDFGFAKYLIENAVSLEKISIDSTYVFPGYDDEMTRIGGQEAEKLRSYVRPETEFKICNDRTHRWIH